ncbi:MAG: hypothetical protein QM495_10015 [Lutibacter sp.]|uniref:hypothetical protein n=1 Tax=Lutibacter sp. TaxID=1925666 RepID=UPI00385BC143
MNTTKILKLFIIMMMISCSNDDNSSQNPIDQLPPETQTGANTFGFLINGEPINITNTSNQTAIYQGGFIQFGAGGVYMVVVDPFTTNTPYKFMDIGAGNSRAEYKEKIFENVFCIYDESDTYEGYVTFTKIDKVNYIISGTFEFSTVTDGCEDIKITNGRFDLEYIP